MKKMVPAILFLVLQGTSLLQSGQTSLQAEVRRLDSEVVLVKEGRAYLLMDFSSGTLTLKNRGVFLREWRLNKARAWGYPAALEPVKLLEKKSRREPKREKIKQGDATWGESGPVALELGDMPVRFEFIMERGIRIYSTSPKKGLGRILDSTETGFRRVFLFPLKTIGCALKKKSFHVLEIEFSSREEAQALYWALDPGTPVLIFPSLR